MSPLNKYLVKLASKVEVRDKLDHQDIPRAFGRGVVGAGIMGGIGHTLGRAVGAAKGKMNLPGAVGVGLGMVSGIGSSLKNQLREQQLHDIKLQGAAQRQEMHEARLKKVAQLLSDQTKKDAVTLGTIGALGGAANLATDKILASKFAGAKTGGKVFAVGAGLGLAADYAGLKIGDAYSKYTNKKK